MKYPKAFGVIGVTAALALALSACSAPAAETGEGSQEGSQSVQELKIGRLGIGSDAIFTLGEQQGIYEDHGISITDTIVSNPPAGLAAVQSGQIDVAYSTVMSFFQARSEGVPIQVIASADGIGLAPEGTEDLAPYDLAGLFVNPDSGITNEADLAGKTVAVLARNGSLEMAIAAAIEREGGDPSTVNWVALDFASAIEALKSGSIDAAGLVSPFTNEALSAGLTQIGAPVAELFGPGAVTAIWVSTPETIEAKGEAIDAFIAAQTEAANYANDNVDEAMTEAKAITGIELPIEELTPTYWVPSLDTDEITRQMELTAKYGYLDAPLDMADACYVPGA
ncbi:MAG: ABC transporter substrate-binding protein [Pseudoclavibacter sp.]